jgi:hypothetical protein
VDVYNISNKRIGKKEIESGGLTDGVKTPMIISKPSQASRKKDLIE